MSYELLYNSFPDVIDFEPLHLSKKQRTLDGTSWYCDKCGEKTGLWLVHVTKSDIGCLCFKCLKSWINFQKSHWMKSK
jgi:hypothetical protein